jgi:hypothetical protein
MNKIEILRLDSLSREPMIIEGFLFKGKNPDAPKVAIVGAMQGDALLPLHSCASLVNFLNNTIKESKILGDILVIPSINHYALNISEKFWPLDKTNINMMFPGYGAGETTQRIASKLFDSIKGYDYGIILATSSDQSTCIAHIELLKSGWEDIEGAKKFGLKMIHHKELESIDTVTLQYNWQLWETKAYSIICPSAQQIDQATSDQILQAMIRFFYKNKILNYHIYDAYSSSVLTKKNIKVIKTPQSGIFTTHKLPGEYVHKGDVIGEITNALSGELIHKIKAPYNGMIATVFNNALVIENAIVYRIAKLG